MKYVYACPNKESPCTIGKWVDMTKVDLVALFAEVDKPQPIGEQVIDFLPTLKGERGRSSTSSYEVDSRTNLIMDIIRWPVDVDGNIVLTERLSWFVEHSMHEEMHMPCMGECGGEAVRIITNAATFYNKGYGYLDKSGCRRDMNLYKVAYDEDPYGYMRQPGELDDLKGRLRKGGKFNPRTQYFT
jgi:hypothetical protein